MMVRKSRKTAGPMSYSRLEPDSVRSLVTIVHSLEANMPGYRHSLRGEVKSGWPAYSSGWAGLGTPGMILATAMAYGTSPHLPVSGGSTLSGVGLGSFGREC